MKYFSAINQNKMENNIFRQASTCIQEGERDLLKKKKVNINYVMSRCLKLGSVKSRQTDFELRRQRFAIDLIFERHPFHFIF